MSLPEIVGWLNDAVVKTVLLFVGGLILKRWAPFVNKAIPVTLTAASGLIALLNGLFPDIRALGSPASFTLLGVEFYPAAGRGARLTSWLWNTFLPVAVAVGAHSAPKNTLEWIRLGAGLFWPKGHPPK